MWNIRNYFSELRKADKTNPESGVKFPEVFSSLDKVLEKNEKNGWIYLTVI